VALRLTGRWLRPPATDQSEPLLVVQVQGRRHRFTVRAGRDGHAQTGTWEATFHLPSWAEPSREGQAALWVGTEVVPVPVSPGASSAAPAPAATAPDAPVPPAAAERTHRLPPPPALGEARPWPPAPAPPAPAPPAPAPAPPAIGAGEMLRPGEAPDPAVETGRTGPLAELLFKESVAALHAELEQRSTDVARLQGTLADARSELEARVAMQSALEAAHSELRGELQDLMSAVGVQREDFKERLATAEQRLATAQDGRAAAESERDRLRQELERLRDELAALTAAREAAAAGAADLQSRFAAAQIGQQQHAAELSSLRDQLAAAHVSRDAAIGEVAGLRAELERLGSELAVTREHHQAQGGDLGEAQRLLAEARSLSDQLRSQSSQ
jgi:predicted  nucleic acid-binding Zn-ribbon protein